MPYRLEQAKTNRGGCNAKICKDNKVKVVKGGLKQGVWVETQERSWWSWRHWGCVTTQVLRNMNNDVDGDAKEVDGFDELDEDEQQRVITAFEKGHVADEDLVSLNPEYNRPHLEEEGRAAERERKKQIRDAEKAAKKAAMEQSNGDVPNGAPSSLPPSPESAKKPAPVIKKRKAAKEEDFSGEEAPAKKKTATAGSKRKAVKEEELSDTEAATKKASTAKKRKTIKEEPTSDAEVPAKSTAKPSRKQKIKSEVDSEAAIEPVGKGARGRGSRKTKDAEPAPAEEVVGNGEKGSAKRRGRPSKSTSTTKSASASQSKNAKANATKSDTAASTRKSSRKKSL